MLREQNSISERVSLFSVISWPSLCNYNVKVTKFQGLGRGLLLSSTPSWIPNFWRNEQGGIIAERPSLKEHFISFHKIVIIFYQFWAAIDTGNSKKKILWFARTKGLAKEKSAFKSLHGYKFSSQFNSSLFPPFEKNSENKKTEYSRQRESSDLVD